MNERTSSAMSFGSSAAPKWPPLGNKVTGADRYAQLLSIEALYIRSLGNIATAVGTLISGSIALTRAIGWVNADARQKHLRSDKATRKPIQRQMREKCVLVELGFSISVTITRGRQPDGTVMQSPGEGLRVKGIDHDMDEGSRSSVLPFDQVSFFWSKIGWVACVVWHSRKYGKTQTPMMDSGCACPSRALTNAPASPPWHTNRS